MTTGGEFLGERTRTHFILEAGMDHWPGREKIQRVQGSEAGLRCHSFVKQRSAPLLRGKDGRVGVLHPGEEKFQGELIVVPSNRRKPAGKMEREYFQGFGVTARGEWL